LILLLAQVFPLAFVFAFGACVGSLLNVVVYRMPRGEGLVFPSSRCPVCRTKLTWRENVPIIGWLLLGGRCRFCKSAISAEYPIVEAFTASLFTLIAWLFYTLPSKTVWLGVPLGAIKPEWALSGAPATWPMLVVLFTLLSCLIAMTLIDARTSTIPLTLTWLPALVALLVHPVHALWVQLTQGHLLYTAPGWTWTIPTPGWGGLGLSGGAVLGLGVGLLLLRAGLLGRSFADYEAWEQQQLALEQAQQGQLGQQAQASASMPSDGAVISSAAAQAGASGQPPAPAAAAANPPADDNPARLWIEYPHARREMVRELAFLAPAVLLGLIGWLALSAWAQANLRPNPNSFLEPLEPGMPLWLQALGGVLQGYVFGGGLVWLFRIGGTLGFGREALGLGDVHLMAAVGACCGWIDASLAFVGAAFVGMAWVILGTVSGGRLPRAIPYGPYLAVATLLVILSKPLIEQGLTMLLHAPEGSLPINIP
jgi:leader peptidase (prepilin peptidase)/N-methyltransferase